MEIFISMDDTDNLETQGTGWLAEDACREMSVLGWGKFSLISRHQLHVHPDIPYTSHNSSMVFTAQTDLTPERYADFLGSFLAKRSAPGSDPGLCVVPEPRPEIREALIHFGLRAKKEVLSKAEAILLAKKLGIHLSGHGGTDDGVIGALAGIGLRLWGNDGRYRGWFHFGRGGEIMTAGQLAAFEAVEDIRTPDGGIVDVHARIRIEDQMKTIRMNGKSTLLVRPEQGGPSYTVVPKEELKRY